MMVPSTRLQCDEKACWIELSCSSVKPGTAKGPKRSDFVYLYLLFAACSSLVYQSYEGLGLSTCITLSASLQFLAYSLLAVKVAQQKSVRGISGKALTCYAVVYCARLSSTTWLLGYLPSDATGDGLYQLLDVMSLSTVLFLLFCVFKKYRHTYQKEEDTFEIKSMLITCFFFAMLFETSGTTSAVTSTGSVDALATVVFITVGAT